jgi:ferredoxin
MTLPSLYLIRFEPLGKSVVASPGTTLLEAASRAGLSLPSTCSGQGECGECCIDVLEGKVSALTTAELEHLSPMQIQNGQRLACCARIYSNVKAYFPCRLLPQEPALLAPSQESSANQGS